MTSGKNLRLGIRKTVGFCLAMPRFGIFRLRDSSQERFRWSPKAASSASAGEAFTLKPSEYRDDGEVEAASPYAVWEKTRLGGNEVRVGDVVVDVEAEALWICKFNGFERAQWAVAGADENQPSAASPTEATPDNGVVRAEGPTQEDVQ
jgi:hypothetical protein